MKRKISIIGLAVIVIAGFTVGRYLLQEKPRIIMIPTCEASSPYDLMQAKKAVSGFMSVDLYSAGLGRLPSVEGVDLSAYDAVFIVGNSHETLKIKEAIETAKAKTKVIVIAPVVVQGNVDLAQHPDISRYWFNRNRENFRRLMVYLGVNFCGLDRPVKPPLLFPDDALYHPDAPGIFTSAEKYLEWYSNRPGTGKHTFDRDRPGVGILFHRSNYTKEQCEVVDALIRGVEQKGGNVFAFYSRTFASYEDLLIRDRKPLVDVIISLKNQLNWRDHKKGIEVAGNIDVPLLYAPVHYYLSPEEWEKNMAGLGKGMISQLIYSEMNGMFDPVVVGGKSIQENGRIIKAPIGYQVEWRIDRALAWARLRRMQNAQKKIAITYYSEGGGKANIGADVDYYLNAQASLSNMFKVMRKRGYDLGKTAAPDTKQLSSMMAEYGSNIGSWHKQEIEKRVREDRVILIPEETYLSWFKEFSKEKQEQVIARWGAPPGNIMVYRKEGKKYIVIPKIKLGNVLLLPHPTWGFLQDKKVLYSSKGVPPHHQYIAFWLWLNREFKADAVITVFSQISLMPGKQSGLSKKDWGGILLGNIPNIHPFPLQANSGLHNKRRAHALVIDYMPTIVTSGLYTGLQKLKDTVSLYEQSGPGTLKERYARAITDEVTRLKIDKELKLDIPSLEVSLLVQKIKTYLHEIDREHMPYGPHILSEPPRGKPLAEMILSMLGREYESHIRKVKRGQRNAQKVLQEVILNGLSPEFAQKRVLGKVTAKVTEDLSTALRYKRNILGCKAEIPRILDALEGRYIFPGPMDDPIRNPEAIPSGRNPQSFDARTFPTKEAWETGKTLVKSLLKQHRVQKGDYPRKVAFVLWSSETTKNHGVLESQILYLLGVRPVWRNGRVKDVSLIKSAELKRPRIDVVVTASGLYRDHFRDKIALLDKAVKLAAAQEDETENFVKENSYFIEKELSKSGYNTSQARAVATARVFSEAMGAYSPGIQFAIPAGDTWKDDKKISDLYISRVGHIYGQNIQGQEAEAAFIANLNKVDAGVFSRSSNVYGILEHPMVASYFGGLKMAVRNTSGKKIEMYISNLRDVDNTKVETLERFYNRELRSRYFNPKWIKGMMKHGYDGTRYMDAFTEDLWIWDVTSPDMVTEEHWNRVYEVYVKDTFDLKMQEYFDRNNPYAMQSMISTMLEVKEKGYWHPSKEIFEHLVRVYAKSVAVHGISGSYGSTDTKLHKDVSAVLKNMKQVPSGLVKEYREKVKQYKGKLEAVKGYEVKEVNKKKEDEKDNEKFRPMLGLVVLLCALALIVAGCWRGYRERFV